jgi:hypothetical protein
MPPDERYTNIPREQLEDVIRVLTFICHNQGLDIKDPDFTFRAFITEINWQCGGIISASTLPYIDSLTPEDRSLYPSSPWLEALIEQYQHVAILPGWQVDQHGTLRGNRGAAYRCVERMGRRLPDLKRFSKMARELGVPPVKARLDLMTDILLEVVSHRDKPLPVWASSDPAPLQRPDGTSETFVPSQFDPWTFRQWVETQTIRGAKNKLEGELLRLDILIDGIEKEGEPSSLWWYPPLDPLNRGGAPAGPRYFDSKPDLLLKVKTAMDYLRAQGIRPTQENVARVVLQRLGRQGRDGEHSNPRSALMRDAHWFGIINWNDLKGQANEVERI